MHVFWTWAPFFWTCTCFLDLTRIFFGPRVTKNVGDLPVCFPDPVGIFFVDLHVFVLDPRIFFSTAKLIVSELGLCFLDPCTCFVDLASIGWGAQVGGTLGGHGGTRYKNQMNAGSWSGAPGILTQHECSAGSC